MSKKVSAQFRRNCTGWDWKEEVRSLVLRKNLNCQSLLLTVFFLCKIPITGPQFQSALNASCSYLQVLGSPTCPCKLLKTLVIHTLKRLASAVQLRPWPPFIFNNLAVLIARFLLSRLLRDSESNLFVINENQLPEAPVKKTGWRRWPHLITE